jgi:hypothetical protein
LTLGGSLMFLLVDCTDYLVGSAIVIIGSVVVGALGAGG